MNIENGKMCPECNLWLPLSRFKKLTSPSALKKYTDGYYWCCSECFKTKEWVYKDGKEPTDRRARRRNKRMRRFSSVESTYGLSEQEYLGKISEQRNVCAICSTKQTGKVLCVDHDHKTGRVRGLLCGNCNIGLGNLKDDVQILQSAIGYLEKYRFG